LPKSTLIFALDAWGEDWLSHGWQQKTGQSIDQVLAKLSNQCSGLLYTQVQREGMLQGIDRQRVTDLVQATRLPVTVAGGVTTTEDVVFLQNLGAHAQIGMALYTGKLSLAESFIACVNFNKSEQGLIPTVVQDRLTKEVLMLAYSTADSLRAALTQGQGIYYSRSRQEIWHKGKTSGHYQTLCHVDLDCDADTLLFQVEQQGAACHLERWSCFPSQTRGFNLATLDRLLAQRQQQLPTGSYTARLLQDSHLNIAKLREETEELIDAKEHPEVRWEAADVLYFTLVLARARGVSLQQIEQELRSRQA
jgi:phosphoribosyl-ATP pyrophosphohydrolase